MAGKLRIVAQDGNVVELEAETRNGKIIVIAELLVEPDCLTLLDAHIGGLVPGKAVFQN